MHVRHAVLADADAIGEAHAEAWRVAYSELFTAHTLAHAIEARRAMWPSVFNDPHFGESTLLVAMDDTDVEGFGHFGPAHADPENGEVYGFYVHPRAWGSSAATMLMAEAVDQLRESGFPEVVLWTHEGAARARLFYARSGWRLTGRRDLQPVASRDEPSNLVEYTRDL